MIDPAQPQAWGSGVPRGLQEHHEGWALGQPLPAEPALMSPDRPGSAAPMTGTPMTGTPGTALWPPLPPPGNGASVTGAPMTGARGAQQARLRGRAVRGQHGAGRQPRGAVGHGLVPGRDLLLAARPAGRLPGQAEPLIFVRSHAAQAFNLTLTATLFAISGGIIGGLLALNSPWAALFSMGPVLFAF